MNSTAIKEAAAVGYPRDKMIGVWWSGAEPDVTPGRRPGQGLQGADAPARRRQVQGARGPREVRPSTRARRVGKDDFAQVLYNRGLINSMLGTEAIRTAQKKFGNKPLTGEQVAGASRTSTSPPPAQGARLRGHAEADQDLLRTTTRAHDQAASSSGTARSGRSSPTTTRPTMRSCADGQGRSRQVRRGEEDHAARLLQGELSASRSQTTARAAAAAARRLPFTGRTSELLHVTDAPAEAVVAQPERRMRPRRSSRSRTSRSSTTTSSWCSRACR